MIESPLVSIILPVYNGEKYIRYAIESIVQQSYKNWELIIIDDCSNDGTHDIVREFEERDSRIVCYRNQINLKLPRSLNRGFSLAKGDYFTWTSDDNILKENMLEVLVNELRKSPEIGMVYSNYILIDADGNQLETVKEADPYYLIYGNVCGASFMYRREVANEVGEYDAAMFLAEDYDYWIRIYCKTEMKHIDEVLYLYRVHDQSLSETRKEKIKEQVCAVLKKNFIGLYLKAKCKEEMYVLFDNVVKESNTFENERLIKLFCKIEKGYYWYNRKKKK